MQFNNSNQPVTQDKKQLKEAEKQMEKEIMKASAGPSLREVELQRLNKVLGPKSLRVKEVQSDGHCLYRAISEQLQLDGQALTVAQLRAMAASHMRSNPDDYAPFLDQDPVSDFETYCW